MLLSKRSAWQTKQLRGPILNDWESYPKGHFGEAMAESFKSFFWESYPKGHFGEAAAESFASFFWESNPKGHFGEAVAESLASFFVLISVSV